jgi:hypothetical protein
VLYKKNNIRQYLLIIESHQYGAVFGEGQGGPLIIGLACFFAGLNRISFKDFHVGSNNQYLIIIEASHAGLLYISFL